jgi:hypothetical protein
METMFGAIISFDLQNGFDATGPDGSDEGTLVIPIPT